MSAGTPGTDLLQIDDLGAEKRSDADLIAIGIRRQVTSVSIF